MRRAWICALLVTGLTVVPAGTASAEPDLSGVDLDAFVHPIDMAVHPIEPSAHAIDIGASVKELQRTETGGESVTVTISSDVLFAFDSAKLSDTAKATIAEIAKKLRGVQGTVYVHGYTDSIGSKSYNLKLSRQRARAVKSVLEGKLSSGVKIVAKGHGEADPVAPNRISGKDNPEGRAKNRRVEITYRSG